MFKGESRQGALLNLCRYICIIYGYTRRHVRCILYVHILVYGFSGMIPSPNE